LLAGVHNARTWSVSNLYHPQHPAACCQSSPALTAARLVTHSLRRTQSSAYSVNDLNSTPDRFPACRFSLIGYAVMPSHPGEWGDAASVHPTPSRTCSISLPTPCWRCMLSAPFTRKTATVHCSSGLHFLEVSTMQLCCHGNSKSTGSQALKDAPAPGTAQLGRYFQITCATMQWAVIFSTPHTRQQPCFVNSSDTKPCQASRFHACPEWFMHARNRTASPGSFLGLSH
jgi:hypothetical protein